MGSMTAKAIAESGVSLEQGIAWHLQGNFYPPIPLSMVQPCVDAIDAYYAENYDKFIELPEGVFWRDSSYAPAWAIIEQHRLDAWCVDEYYEEEE